MMFNSIQNPFESELIETSDGSHTLKLKVFDEQYHSLNGALQESQHVFLSSGLNAFATLPDPMNVLEVGMGTGLNALLTAREAIKNNSRVFYDAIEPYPIQQPLLQKLNFHSLFAEDWMKEIFDQIHSADAGNYIAIREFFHLKPLHSRLQDLQLENNKYHLVYFDAFGPDTQPDMWSEQVFEQIFQCMKPGAVLVTYCVKGSVRRAMKTAGLDVQKIPGPAGKREMSRATKPNIKY